MDVDLITYGFNVGLGVGCAFAAVYAVVLAAKRLVQHISWRRRVAKGKGK